MLNFLKISARLISKKAVFYFLIFCLFGCKNTTKDTPYKNNAIATGHPLATQAGEAMFEAGGNAFDAIVAAGFALSVVESSMSGLGGRFVAIYQTSGGEVKGVNASTEIPAQYVPTEERFPHGYKTIAIPGVVAGLLKLHEEGGSLPLQKVLQPAIKYATEGYAILPGEAKRQAMAVEDIQLYEGTKYHFLKASGEAYQAGEQVVQKDLAKVLERISQNGHAGFYEGETATRIAEDMATNGGYVSLEDLKNYRALGAKILEGTYKGHKVHSLYLPSYGAVTIQILQMLDRVSGFETEGMWAYYLGKITAKAYAYRRVQDDQDSLKSMLSTATAKRLLKEIDDESKIAFENRSTWPESWKVAMGHTTHLTTADRFGNVASLTQTIGPNMGSKVATKGLGFLYATTMGGYLGSGYQPGDRASSHVIPTLFSKDGEVVLALGAAGGSRIVTAVTQVAERYFSRHYDLQSALEAPRVYPDKDTLQLENHEGILWSEEVQAFLTQKGSPFKFVEQPARFGRVHAVALDTIKKQWIGAADPDWEGTASGKE